MENKSNPSLGESIFMFFFSIFIFIIGAFTGSMITQKSTLNRVCNEAVKAGVAEWVANKDGAPEFRWKKP